MATLTRSLTSGAAGALALTAIHEFARGRVEYAPRMDLLGMRALRRLLPRGRADVKDYQLHRLALAGDLVANSLYYAAIAAPTRTATWTRAAVLGAAAGIGALLLPKPIGLGAPPHSHLRANQLMTVGWYMAGALAAATVGNRLMRDGSRRTA